MTAAVAPATAAAIATIVAAVAAAVALATAAATAATVMHSNSNWTRMRNIQRIMKRWRTQP